MFIISPPPGAKKRPIQSIVPYGRIFPSNQGSQRDQRAQVRIHRTQTMPSSSSIPVRSSPSSQPDRVPSYWAAVYTDQGASERLLNALNSTSSQVASNTMLQGLLLKCGTKCDTPRTRNLCSCWTSKRLCKPQESHSITCMLRCFSTLEGH